VSVVSDAAGALAYLGRQGEYEDVAAADVVVLDAGLPSAGAGAVLDVLGDAVAAVILTGSESGAEPIGGADARVVARVRKPGDLARLAVALRAVDELWLSVVRYRPRQSESD
jgi:DNA-binding response OmpR family regulator